MLKKLLIAACLGLVLTLGALEAFSRFHYHTSSMQVLARFKTSKLAGLSNHYPSLWRLWHLIDAIAPEDERYQYHLNPEATGPAPNRLVGAQQRLLTLPYDSETGDSLVLPVQALEAENHKYEILKSILHKVRVTNSDELLEALTQTEKGSYIELAPGEYSISYSNRSKSSTGHAGTALEPIIVGTEQLGTVKIMMRTLEGFRVHQPYWVFENLMIIGDCQEDWQCEHAFHVYGQADHLIVRNNIIKNFNAHLKINGSKGQFPDHGLVEYNTLYNETPRRTKSPVTYIDAVAVSDWIVKNNIVNDFAKNGGNRVSYGVFFKGGGSNNILQENLVRCEDLHSGGVRVGLSFGGGGTGKSFFRPGTFPIEQSDSLMINNLITDCPFDVGIYLNHAENTQLIGNQFSNTQGEVQERTLSADSWSDSLFSTASAKGDETQPLNVEIGMNFTPWQPYEQISTLGSEVIYSKDYPSLAAAAKSLRNGQTLVIAAGEYAEAFFVDASYVSIIGEGHVILNGQTAGGKAAIVNRGNYNSITNLECKNIQVSDRNGSCVRQEGIDLLLEHVYFHDSQQGILSGVNEGTIEIRDSRFENLGQSGRAHGIYVAGDQLIVRNSLILGSKSEGHEVKSRARQTLISSSTIASFSAKDSRLVDIPNGGILTISDSVLAQGPNSANQDAIGYGLEGMKGDDQQIAIERSLLILERVKSNKLLHIPDHFSRQKIRAENNVIVSKDPVQLEGLNHIFKSRDEAGIAAYPHLPKLTQ